MRHAVLLAILLCSGPAAADLYRWVDPDTGSVKFSSYPPPWYGDEVLQRRAPKVEHIPVRGPGGSARAEPSLDQPKSEAPSADALERQRRTMLQQIEASVGRPGGAQEMQKQLEAFAAVTEQLDKVNPQGAAARRTETEALLQKLIKGGQP